MLQLNQEGALIVKFGYKFRLRRSEWIAGVQCLLWGIVLLLPTSTFDNGHAYDVIRAWPFVTETSLGGLMLAVGAARIGGLFVNGARKTVTPWVRLGSALVGAGIFTAITLGFAASGVIGTWIAAWPVLAVTEYFNIYDTARDARQVNG